MQMDFKNFVLTLALQCQHNDTPIKENVYYVMKRSDNVKDYIGVCFCPFCPINVF